MRGGPARCRRAGRGDRAIGRRDTDHLWRQPRRISAVAFGTALVQLVGDPTTASALTLPLGLPWLGAHFRVDALAAFFLLVANLGGAAASLFALGYGRHEQAPLRVLPFYPAFLAGMNLVVLADDAFTFLLSWEFMSLTSWALVMAHHRVSDNARAGYIYLVMASAGHVDAPARLRPARRLRRRLRFRGDARRRSRLPSSPRSS